MRCPPDDATSSVGAVGRFPRLGMTTTTVEGDVVLLTTVWPGARRSGSEAVTQAFVDALRATGRRVHVVAYLRAGDAGPEHADDHIAGARPIETDHAGARHLAAWWASALLRGLPYSSAKYRSRDYARIVTGRLAQAPALVIVDHAQLGWTLPLLGERPGVYLAHNVEHGLYGEQARAGSVPRRAVYAREARRVRRLEERLARWARQTWALSDDDAAALRALGAADARVLAPPPAVRPVTAAADADVVLLGRWTWAANAVGLRWFQDEVVPLLPAGTTVRIGGAGSPLGEVDDASAFLAGGRVIAIPAQAGAGVQVKTLDAIATGRPVVATSLATRGLRDLPPTVTVADDPRAFAAALTAPRAGDGAAAWVQRRRTAFAAAVAEAVADVV